MKTEDDALGTGTSSVTTVTEDQSTESLNLSAEEQQLSAYEDKINRTNFLLLANALYRPTLLRIVAAAAEATMTLFDFEALIQSLPEFKTATQPPYFLIEWLIDTGALVFIEVDAEGQALTAEQREGKTADEIDDLIEDIIIEITDVGREVLEAYDPKERLMALLNDKPQRFDTYVEILEFLTDKQSYNAVDKLLRGRPILTDGRSQGESPMQPSVFVDKLASAGGIIFDEGWIITPEGLSLLEALKAPESSSD
jgi:hypothetical protein